MARKDKNVKPAGIKTWSGNAARSIKYVSIDLMKSAMPYTAETIGSVRSTTSDLRKAVTDTRTTSNTISNRLSRNSIGKKARELADQAMEDLKSGNLAIRRDEKDTFDTFGDLDFDFDDAGVTLDINGQSSIMPEAKIAARQSQEISKAVLAGGANTVSALRSMTNAISSANIKSSQASAAQITNVTLLGIQQASRDAKETNTHLASINQNLVSMIEFNNNNVSIANQAMLSYFDKSLEMLEDLKNGTNTKNSKSRTSTAEGNNGDELSFLSGGFSLGGYGKHVKKNFDNSIVGSMLSMAKTFRDMDKMMGEKPKSMTHRGLEMLLPLMMPGNIKAQGKSFDQNFGQIMQNALMNIGDMKHDYSGGFGAGAMAKRFLGEILGTERSKEAKISMGNFYKDEMSWNGMANRVLIEAIPSYLANIEASLSGGETRFYDPRTGRFKTSKKLKREYDEEREYSLQGAMNESLQNLNKYLESNEISKDKMKKIQDQMNDLINERVNENVSSKDYRERVSKTLGGSLTNPQFEKVILGLEGGFESAMKQMEELRRSIESNHDYLGYRQINNDRQDLNQLNSNRKIDAFKWSGRESSSIFGGSLGNQIQMTAMSFIPPEEIVKGFQFKVTPDFFRQYKSNSERMDQSALDRMVEKEVKSQLSKSKKKRFVDKFNIGNRFTAAAGMTNTVSDKMAGAEYEFFRRTSGYSNFREMDSDQPSGGTRGRGPGPTPSSPEPTGPAGSRATEQGADGAARALHPTRRKMRGATSRGNQSTSSTGFRREIQSAQANITALNDRSVLETDPDRLVENQDKLSQGIEKSGEAMLATTDTNTKLNSFVDVMGGLMLSMQNSFNSIFSGIFGKKGMIHRVWDSDWRKKFFDDMNKKLFNEDTGIFKNQVKWLKSNAKDVGRKTVDELKGGYNKFHDLAMKGFFGEDYEDQEFYQKYLSRFKFKHKSVTAETAEKSSKEPGTALMNPAAGPTNLINAQQNRGKKDTRTQSEIAFGNGPKRGARKVALNALRIGRNKKVLDSLRESNPKAYERLMYLSMNPEENIGGEAQRLIADAISAYKKEKTEAHIPSITDKAEAEEPQLPATGKEEVSSSNKPRLKSFKINQKKPMENAEAELALAVSNTSLAIQERGKEVTDTLMGEDETPEKKQQSFWKRFKSKLPKVLAAGVVGGALSAMTGGHLGIIGSMFLPGGPIGGAIVGMGLSLLAGNKGFMETVFGKKQEDGTKTGGIISNRLQASFKKALPFMASGAILGVMKSALLHSVVGGGASGVLLGSLLPGGIIGGALMGVGMSLLKNNDTFNDIVFGKKDENGDRKRNYFGKGMKSMNQKMMNMMPKVKGGLKGLGVGAVSGAILANMGVLGASLSLGGPVGMGVAGLGMGILSSTKRFNQYLFGHEELDEDGNPTGARLEDGLLPRLKNLIVVNVLDPIKQQIEDSVTNFAYFTKKAILYPFRTAFGPILDAMGALKDDIGDFVKDKFEVVAEGIGNIFKKTFDKITQPFTKLLGKIGRGLVKTVELGAKMATLPITAPLRMLSMMTAPERTMSQLNFYRARAKNVMGQVNEGDGKNRSIIGKGAEFAKHWFNKDEKAAAEDSWIDAWGVNGGNHMDWRSINREKRQDKLDQKARLKWRPIDKLREGYVKEDRGNGSVYWSDSKIDKMRKAFIEKGIDEKDISNEADLRKLIFKKDDWKDQVVKRKSEAQMTQEAMVNGGENTKQAKAREKTSKFQDDTTGLLQKIYDSMLIDSQNEIDRQNNKKHSKHEATRRQRLLKRLNKRGIDPRSLGITDVLDVDNMSDQDWDLYESSEEAKHGDYQGWYRKNLHRWNSGVKEGEDDTEAPAPSTSRTAEKAKWNEIAKNLIAKGVSFEEAYAKADSVVKKLRNKGNFNTSHEPTQEAKMNDIPKTDAEQAAEETAATAEASTEKPKRKKRMGFFASMRKGSQMYNKFTSTSTEPAQEAGIDGLTNAVAQQNELAREQLDAQHSTNEALYPPGDYNRKDRTKAVESNDAKPMADKSRDDASTTQSEMTSSIKSGMKGALSWFSDKKDKAAALFSKKKKEEDEDKEAKGLSGWFFNRKKKKDGEAEGEGTEEEGKKKGKVTSIFGKLKGFAGGALGLVGNALEAGLGSFGALSSLLLGVGGPLVKLGIIGALGYFLKKPIEKYGPKIWGTAKDFFTSTVAPFMTQTAFPAILTGLGNIRDLIVKNIPAIIDGAINITGQIMGGVGKWFMGKLGFGEKKEKMDVDDTAAIRAAGNPVYIDPKTGQPMRNLSGNDFVYNDDGSVAVDESGNPVYQKGQRSRSMRGALGRGALEVGTRLGMKKLAGKAVGKTVERGVMLGAKVAGGLAGGMVGLFPGGLGTVAGSALGAKTGATLGRGAIKGVKKVGIALVKSTTENKGIVNTFIKKLVSCFKSLSQNKTLGKVLKMFGKDSKLLDPIVKTVEKQADNAMKGAADAALRTASTKIENATVKNTAKSASAVIPVAGVVIQVGFGIWNGITGWKEASRLFGVHKDEVDWKMKLISSIYKIITGLPWVWIFDLAMEILSMFTNYDFKQSLATWIYKAITSDPVKVEELTRNQNNMGMEAKLYSEQTGNEMSAMEYKNMTQKTVAGSMWDSIRGKNEPTYSQYHDQVAQMGQPTTTFGSDGKTNATINNVTNNYFYGSNMDQLADPNWNPGGAVYGPGPSTHNTYNNNTNNYYGEKQKKKTAFYGPGDSIPVYKQGDSKWANQAIGKMPSGTTSTMASGGCGPTALASVASGLTRQAVTPSDVAKIATSNGYIAKGGATADLFTSGASQLGLSSTRVNPRQITDGLSQGKPVIIAGKSDSSDSHTPFTKAGHVVTATGLDRSGNVQIADPMSGRKKSYPIDVVRRGMTDGWAMDRGSSGYGKPSPVDMKPRDETLGYGFWSNIRDALIGTKEEREGTKAVLEANQAKSAAEAAEKAKKAKDSKTIQLWDTGGQLKNNYTKSTGRYNVSPSAAAYNPATAKEYEKVLDGKGNIVSGSTKVYQPSNATPAALQGSGKTDEDPISLADIGMGGNISSYIPKNVTRAFVEKVCIINVRDDIIKLLNAMSDDAFLDLRDYMISGRLWGDSIIDTPYVQKLNMIYKSGKSKKLSKTSVSQDIGGVLLFGAAYPIGKSLTADKATDASTVHTSSSGRQHGGGGAGFGNPAGYGVILPPKLVRNNDLKKSSEKYIQKKKEKEVQSGLKLRAQSIVAAQSPTMYTSGLPNNRTVLVNAFLSTRANDEAGILGFDQVDSIWGMPYYSPDDPRWASIPYKGGTIADSGHDIIAMASILSAYTQKGITPEFLMKKALPDTAAGRRTLFSPERGVNWDDIFNATTGLQRHPALMDKNGHPLTVSRDGRNNATFFNNIKNAIPMLMSGYEYQGSLFGGTGSALDPDVLNRLGGAVSLYGNDASIYSLNAFTDPNNFSPVSQSALNDLVGGEAKMSALLDPAYLFKSTDGKNPLNIPADQKQLMDAQMEKMEANSEKQSLPDKIRSGFNIIADYFKKFAAIGTEFVSAKLTGRDYERQLDDEGNILTEEELKDQEQATANEAIINDALNGGTFVGGDPYFASDDYVGKYVKRFESGSKGSMATGHCGNDGGMSYGSYQMIWGANGADGSAQQFWRKYYASKYGTPSSYQDLVTLWKKAASDDPAGFFANEHAFIADQYYNAALPKLNNFDPNKHSRAAQESIWSWSVHRGAGGAAKEFNSIGMPSPQTTSPSAWLNAVYDKRAAVMIEKNHKSIATGRYGTGADSERATLLGIGNMSPLSGSMSAFQGPEGATPEQKAFVDNAIKISVEKGKALAKSAKNIVTDPYGAVHGLQKELLKNKTVNKTVTSIKNGVNSFLSPFTKNGTPNYALADPYGTGKEGQVKYSAPIGPQKPVGKGPVGYGLGPVGYAGEEEEKAKLPEASTASLQSLIEEQRDISKNPSSADTKDLGVGTQLERVTMVLNARMKSSLTGIPYEDALNTEIEAYRARQSPNNPDAGMSDDPNNQSGSISFGKFTGGPRKTDNTKFAPTRKKVVEAIMSREGKNSYTQSAKRSMVANGFGDCSSTVQWATQVGAGIDVGGYTGAQWPNAAGELVDSTPGGPNEGNLFLGDLLFYRSKKPNGRKDNVGHVEMYIGGGTRMGHGSGIGPKRSPVTDSGDRYLGAKRFVGAFDKSGTSTAKQMYNTPIGPQKPVGKGPVGYGLGDSKKGRKKSGAHLPAMKKSWVQDLKQSTGRKESSNTIHMSAIGSSGHDDVSKGMNLLDSNVNYGEGDITTPLPSGGDLNQKLQVALNADGVENKLDGILQVLGAFFNYAKSQPKAGPTQQSFYGTAVNVNGSKKPGAVVVPNSNGFGTDTRQVAMRKIHEGIAKRRF